MSNQKSKKKKILFLTQVYYPDPSSTSQLFTPLLEKLTKDGFEVTVLAGKTVERTNLEKNGVKIFQCGFKIDQKKNLFFRFISYASYLIHAFWMLLFTDKNTLVIAVTNPPFNAQIIFLGSLIRKYKYQYIFLDIYPEGLYALGKLKSKFIMRVWRFFNKIAYHKAQNLYCLGRDMINLISKNYQISSNNLVYLPHWSASENNSPIKFSNSKTAKRLNLKDKFVVQYSGNMGIWHDMNTFIRSAKLLEDNKEIVFMFVGDGIKKQGALSLANELDLKNIIWRDFVPIDELSDSLACCHVALISLRNGLEGIAVPCKFYGILESERCVLASVPKDSEIAFAIEEDDIGFRIEPGDQYDLADKIRLLANDRNMLNTMSNNARQSYEKRYCIDLAVKTVSSSIGTN